MVLTMKHLTIIILGLSLSGCGGAERITATFTGYSEMCVDGIAYLQFTSGAAVKIDVKTDKPQHCE